MSQALDVMLQKADFKKRCTPRQNHPGVDLETFHAFSHLRQGWDEEFENWNRKCQKLFRKGKKLASRKAKAQKAGSLPEVTGEVDGQRPAKKHKQDSQAVNPVSQLPPAPGPKPDTMLFCEQPKLEEIFREEDAISSPPLPALKGSRARFGRGGRLVFDRWVLLDCTPSLWLCWIALEAFSS